ncbi:DNA-binding transcriptional regulator, XRE-family HTH domain [Natronincola peptidivorans]|uniref:DNA-binding transcriptional regulator, XRE-family HTH domain n=1 Tax=Natronincola peptidivorans TaxID=426128 RepID=A0A1I0E105_9FIRM|nr:helix-turn-helix domain-containing protein [Natronincola peptidivorans]SET38736.1 DNA-binding transcriptional regulator, XRE-family HTH domain [Natronincola peptidivorans]
MVKLNERLKELRTARNMTQQELAQELNLGGKQIISSYEKTTNPSEPSIEILIHMAKFFNVSLDYLLGKSDYSNPELIQSVLEDFSAEEKAKLLSPEVSSTMMNLNQTLYRYLARTIHAGEINNTYLQILKCLTEFTQFFIKCSEQEAYIGMSNPNAYKDIDETQVIKTLRNLRDLEVMMDFEALDKESELKGLIEQFFSIQNNNISNNINYLFDKLDDIQK